MIVYLYLCITPECNYVWGRKYLPSPVLVKTCRRCGAEMREVEVEVPRPR